MERIGSFLTTTAASLRNRRNISSYSGGVVIAIAVMVPQQSECQACDVVRDQGRRRKDHLPTFSFIHRNILKTGQQ